MAQRKDVTDFKWFIVDTDSGLMLKMLNTEKDEWQRCGYVQNCYHSAEKKDEGVLKFTFTDGTTAKKGLFFAFRFEFERRREEESQGYNSERNQLLWARLDGCAIRRKWVEMASVINEHLVKHYAEVKYS